MGPVEWPIGTSSRGISFPCSITSPHARIFVALIVVLPLVLSTFVPPSTLNEVCNLRFAGKEILIHSVFVTVAFCVMLTLGISALLKSLGENAQQSVEINTSREVTLSHTFLAEEATGEDIRMAERPELWET